MNSKKLKELIKQINDLELDHKLEIDFGNIKISVKRISEKTFVYNSTIDDPLLGFKEASGEMYIKFIEHDLHNFFSFFRKLDNERKIETISNKLSGLPLGGEIKFKTDFDEGSILLEIKRIEKDLYTGHIKVANEKCKDFGHAGPCTFDICMERINFLISKHFSF